MIDIEAIAADIIECAIKVHKALGPGLLESAYQHCRLMNFGNSAETRKGN